MYKCQLSSGICTKTNVLFQVKTALANQDCQKQHLATTTIEITITSTTKRPTAAALNFLISVENFDDKVSNAQKTLSVTCCHRNQSLTNVTCGQGLGCGGKCSAMEAILCPSNNCTGDMKDCQLELNKGFSSLTQSSDEFKYCVPSCRVLFQPECCLHPTCLDAKPRNCKWTQYFSGLQFFLLQNAQGMMRYIALVCYRQCLP